MNIKSEFVKEMRIAKGLTQKETAERLGVSEATVSRYESGQITSVHPDILIAYSKLFNVPVSDLYTGQNEDWANFLAEESLYDPRIVGFMEYLSEQSRRRSAGELRLTEDEVALIKAYRTANSHTQQIVKCALEI